MCTIPFCSNVPYCTTIYIVKGEGGVNQSVTGVHFSYASSSSSALVVHCTYIGNCHLRIHPPPLPQTVSLSPPSLCCGVDRGKRPVIISRLVPPPEKLGNSRVLCVCLSYAGAARMLFTGRKVGGSIFAFFLKGVADNFLLPPSRSF